MRYGEDGPVYAGVWMIGNRTLVERLKIRDGRIVAEMIVHGPDDPACCPTVRVIEEFTLLRDHTSLGLQACVKTPSIRPVVPSAD